MNQFKDNVETDPKTSYHKSGRNLKKEKVLNKAPSDRQITAEQIIREAYEHRVDEFKPQSHRISNEEELKAYQLSNRVEFEQKLRRQPHSINCWLRYAKWEESQKEWERVRSIYERALNVDYQNRGIWLKYAEFEMKNRFPNHARNVWDRAVKLLPRTDQLWYKYALMEEKLKNIDKSRQIFERWMKWNPPPSAWESYIKLEMRCGGNLKNRTARARKIWTKFCAVRPSVDSFLKWAKFESKFGQLEHARAAFASALEMLGEKAFDVHFFSEFAALEARAGETEKARKIYRFALEKLQMSQAAAAELFANFDKFEKQRGSRKDVDDLVFQKRRFEIENKLKERPQDYDAWFDLIKLFESNADSPYSNQSPKNKSHIISEKSPKNKSQKISEQFSDEEEKSREKIKLEAIEIYERAVAAVPPADEKRLWSRYIFVWIRYAIFCELKLNDLERARAVYRKALRVVPHEKFTFAKLWLLAAQFEIRFSRARKSEAVLAGTRKMLGEAIGRCPKLKLFRGYIEIETKLFAIKRCRKLYEAMLRFAPENCEAWHSYAAMESALGEIDRARAIYELGVNQDALDMPERLWAHYVDFEVDLTKNELNNINEKNELKNIICENNNESNNELFNKNNKTKNGENERENNKTKNGENELINKNNKIKNGENELNKNGVEKGKKRISELFERLLKKTKNIKVWLNFAETFRKLGDLAKTRSVFGRADEWFKSEGAVSNIPRAELLRKWLDFERNELGNLQKFGDGMVRADTNKQRERVEELERKQPREVRRRKALIDPAGNEAGHEDYVDYIFPDAKDAQTANLKLLSMAHKWKKSKQN